jgi:MerR family copper efflux transcriptional regulator
MRIGELAARTGLATSAIRYYEAQGVLSAPTRGTNGYRCYAEDDIERLRIIRKSQNLGFTLDVIRGLFAKDGVCLYDDHTLATVDARLRGFAGIPGRTKSRAVDSEGETGLRVA